MDMVKNRGYMGMIMEKSGGAGTGAFFVYVLVCTALAGGGYYTEGLLGPGLALVLGGCTVLLWFAVQRALHVTLLLPTAVLVLLGVGYALHAAAGTVSVEGSVHKGLRMLLYGAFVLIALAAARHPVMRKGLLLGLHAAGALIIWSALAAWLGWPIAANMLMWSDNPQVSAVGVRLGGLLQYPNTLGAVAGAYWLLYVLLLGVSKEKSSKLRDTVRGITFKETSVKETSVRETNVRETNVRETSVKETRSRVAVWHRVWVALQVVPAAIVLLLTESRGAWLAVLVGAAAALLLTVREVGVRALLRTSFIAGSAAFLAAAISLVILSMTLPLQGQGFGQLQGQGQWHGVGQEQLFVIALVAILIAAVAGGAILFAGLIADKLASQHAFVAAGGATALLVSAGILLFQGEASDRISSARLETAGSRGLQYADGWRLWLDSPWYGYGGDAWRAQFRSIQQLPYVGSQMHSGVLDMLLELGLMGFALFVLLLWLLRPAKELARAIWSLPAVVLLLHAAIDFDFAYGFYWLLMLGMLAAGSRISAYSRNSLPMAALPGEQRENERREYGVNERKGQRSGQRESERREYGVNGRREYGVSRGQRSEQWENERDDLRTGWRGSPRGFRAACCAVIVLLAAAGFAAAGFATLRLEAASTAREAAVAAANEAARTQALRAALSANPAWTRIRLELAPLVPAEARTALLAAGLRYAPQSAPLRFALGKAFAEQGLAPQALPQLRRAVALDRYNKAMQTEALRLLAFIAVMQLQRGEPQEARAVAQAGRELYAAYAALVYELKTQGNRANDRDFAMLPEATAYELFFSEQLASLSSSR